jgi:hypothetical protein
VAAVIALVAVAEGANHLIDDSAAPHRIHSLMHALVSATLVAGLLAQVGRRQVPAGVQLVAAIAVASGLADLGGGRFGGLEVVAAVAVRLLFAISPDRSELVRRGRTGGLLLATAGLILLAAAA